METTQVENDSSFKSNLIKSRPYKFILSNFKFLIIGTLVIVIVLAILWINFVTSTHKITSRVEQSIDDNSVPENIFPVDGDTEIVELPEQTNPNFHIVGLEDKIRIRPFSGAAIDVKPSNFNQVGSLLEFNFGIGDCNNDLSVCDHSKYAEFAHIDTLGGFKFIGTKEGLYKIPISIYYEGEVARETLTIEVSSSFTDADIQGGYYLTSAYPYQKVLEPGYSDYFSSTEFIRLFQPKTDCSELGSKAIGIRSYNPYSCEAQSFKARGDYKVGIVYLLPSVSQLPKQDGKTIIDYLDNAQGIYDVCKRNSASECDNDGSTNKVFSFYYVPQYYKNEAKKYGVTDFNLKFTSYGIFEVSDVPRYAYDRDMNELQSIFKSAIGSEYTKIQANNDIIAYVYLDTDRKDGEKASFVSTIYDDNLFVHISSPSQGYVDSTPYFSLAQTTGGEVETFAHELGHIFEASDKYTQVDRSIATGCRREGLGNPDQSPLFPQKTTDLFCGKTFESQSDFDSPTGGSSVTFNHNFVEIEKGVVINRYTAKEIGWE